MTTKTTTTKTRDRFLNALDETYEAVLGAIEATEERGHKVSRTVLEEARKGEKEALELTRKWVDAPTEVYENLGAMIDLQARAQRRLLELVRESLGGAGEYRSEVQHALEQAIRANREATDATVDVAREAVSRAIERVRGAGPNGRRRAAKPTRVPVASAERQE